ncbi:hypothetical protein PHISP_00176 [Aspergillus sp. HF37]|nr:hypothetical protein PHISP_00176 [Aspergillus sp. HF37]
MQWMLACDLEGPEYFISEGAGPVPDSVWILEVKRLFSNGTDFVAYKENFQSCLEPKRAILFRRTLEVHRFEL